MVSLLNKIPTIVWDALRPLTLFAILAWGYNTISAPAYALHQVYNDSGYSYVYIKNNTPDTLYCYIKGVHPDVYFQDFYVRGYSDSGMYQEPNGRYTWLCQ